MNSTTKTGREGGTQILCSFCDKSSQEYYPRAGGKKSWHPECLAAYNRGEKNVRGENGYGGNGARPTGFNKDNDKARNGPIYKTQWAFREEHEDWSIAKVHKAWEKKTGEPWLTPKQINLQSETPARRRKRVRAAEKAVRHSTKLIEYVGKGSKRLQGKGRERAIAKDRKTQCRRERWAFRTGIWRLGKLLGLWHPTTHYIVDHHKEEGFDFDIVSTDGKFVQFRVDAKGQFITTPAQDAQIERGWTSGTRHFLLNYNKYKECREDGIRERNGSIWK
jgi:hypothetical protein